MIGKNTTLAFNTKIIGPKLSTYLVTDEKPFKIITAVHINILFRLTARR